MAFNPDKYLEEKYSAPEEQAAFNPDSYLSEKAGFPSRALASVPEITKLESALRGGAQGATLGLAPQLAGLSGAVPTALNSLTGSGGSLQDLLEAYRASRDTSKQKFKQAEEENPKSYFAGNLTGSLAPAMLSGGLSEGASAGSALAQGAKLGAKYGAVSGAAHSEGDLTKGELADVLK
jgi:hypothetical protein